MTKWIWIWGAHVFTTKSNELQPQMASLSTHWGKLFLQSFLHFVRTSESYILCWHLILLSRRRHLHYMLHLTVFHLVSAGLSFSAGLSYVSDIFWGPSALRCCTSLSFVYFLRVFHEFSIFSWGLHRFSVSFVHFLRALYSLPFIHFAQWLSFVRAPFSLLALLPFVSDTAPQPWARLYIYIYSQKRPVYTKRDFWLQYIKRNIWIRYCASALSSTRYIYIVQRHL